MRFSGSHIKISNRQDTICRNEHIQDENNEFILSIEKFKQGPEALQSNALLNLVHCSSGLALQFFRDELKTPNTPSNKLILDALSCYPLVRHLVIKEALEALAKTDNPSPQIYLSCMENLAGCGVLGLEIGRKQFPLIEKMNLEPKVKEAGVIKLAESMPTLLIDIILNRNLIGMNLNPLEVIVLQNWQSIANKTIKNRLSDVKSKDSALMLLLYLKKLNPEPEVFLDLTKQVQFKFTPLEYPKSKLAVAKFLALVGNKKPLERIKAEIALDTDIMRTLEA